MTSVNKSAQLPSNRSAIICTQSGSACLSGLDSLGAPTPTPTLVRSPSTHVQGSTNRFKIASHCPSSFLICIRTE